jgi:hypothetical protein
MGCRLEQDTPTEYENSISSFRIWLHLDGDNAPHTLLCAPSGKKGMIMARPKKILTEPKSHCFVVRLTDTQHEIIKNYAEKIGMSMAEYIRHQAINGKIEISYPIVASVPDLQKLTAEFGKIGSNLNQIARYFNTGGMQSKAIREDINECIAELMEASRRVTEMAGEFNGNTQTLNE